MNHDLKQLLRHPILSYRAFKWQVGIANGYLERTGQEKFRLPRWTYFFAFIAFQYMILKKVKKETKMMKFLSILSLKKRKQCG